MNDHAVVITGGLLDTIHAKTAHGLIRGSERFKIAAIIDRKFAGRDAGEVLDGKSAGIPVFETVADAVANLKIPPRYAIVGVATKGGVIPDSLKAELHQALLAGVGIINGLHHAVSDIPELMALAREHGLEIVDVRKPKPIADLHFWSGDILQVRCPKIAVLGTDCALGKRTTARLLVQMMRQAGYKAEMIYTGQTGWMQGSKYGFIFDATLNDFVSGELEHAVVSCWKDLRPDLIFIEGQSSLRNPSGPAGAEWLLSAAADGVILLHSLTRGSFKGLESYPARLPDPEEEIALIRMYGVHTMAVALHTAGIELSSVKKATANLEQKLGIPVIAPLWEGTGRLLPLFERMIDQKHGA